MILLALDLARKTGVAFGDTIAGKPVCSVWDLGAGADGGTHYAGVLGYLLRDFFRTKGRPERIVVEARANPKGFTNAVAIESQTMLHGALHAIGGIYRIPITTVEVNVWRRSFCGKANALPRGKSPRTGRDKAEARKANKQMAIDRAVMLGWLQPGSSHDAADAAGLWAWGMVNLARTAPRELMLFA